MDLLSIEFYGTPDGQVVIQQSESPLEIYEPANKEFTALMIDRISTFYPEAFKELGEHYKASAKNPEYYQYLMVHRFIRCNFKEFDNQQDVDHQGVFRFEYVSCPLRGECKFCGVICQPKFNSSLSGRETEIMRMYFESYKPEEIAEKLFISPATVLKHKRNSLEKLGLHKLSEFISYASRHKLFENE